MAQRISRETLENVRDYMARNFHEPLSIERLSGMAGLSPKYFVDLFKKTYGQSAMDYLTDIRISRAKLYLRQTDKPLREIALKVGYSDEFYFSRKFKKEVGVAPSAYAKNRTSRIAACSAAAVGQLLALDVIPVAAPLDSKWTAYYYNLYYSEIEVHLRVDSRDREAECDKLIKARADVILGHEPLEPDWQQRLLLNAQRVYIPEERDRWDAQLLEIARLLDREAQAEVWLNAFGRKAELASRQTAAAVGSDPVLVLRLCGRDLHAYCNRGIRDVLYEHLKLRSAYSGGGSLYNEPITLERLHELDPARVFLLVCPDAETRVQWLALQHIESWRRLRAVQSGYVYLIPSDPWFEYSAVAVDRILDEAVLLLTGKNPNAGTDQVHGFADAPEL